LAEVGEVRCGVVEHVEGEKLVTILSLMCCNVFAGVRVDPRRNVQEGAGGALDCWFRFGGLIFSYWDGR